MPQSRNNQRHYANCVRFSGVDGEFRLKLASPANSACISVLRKTGISPQAAVETTACGMLDVYLAGPRLRMQWQLLAVPAVRDKADAVTAATGK